MSEAEAPVLLTLAEQLEALSAVALLVHLKFAVKFWPRAGGPRGWRPGTLPCPAGRSPVRGRAQKPEHVAFQLAGVGLPISFPHTHRFVEPSVGLF